MSQSSYAVGRTGGSVARQYGPYIEADWGLANHWYPAAFSHEVEKRGLVATTIGGHEIAVSRDDDGRAWAIADRCIHKGVKLSAKPMCFADKTLTCWYHGFTYDLEDGNLKTIVGSPDDKLINNAKTRAYPTEEVGGIIWVFVGDDDYEVPPLSTDLPPKVTDKPNSIAHFFDEGVLVRGIRRPLVGNWRLAVENGLDPGHLLVHHDNQIVVALDRAMPLGMKALTEDATELVDIPDGPKGVVNRYDKPENYEAVLENPLVDVKARGTVQFEPFRVSAWLPGTIMVENWPLPGYAQYEFFPPIDDHHHYYWEVIVYHGGDEDHVADFNFKYENFFEPLGLREFNDHDILAREQTEPFYEKFDGWNNEILADQDFSVVAWRKHASKFIRGYFESPFTEQD